MSKGKLKRLIEWCPRPEKPLTITLKRYAIPTTILISVSIVLTSFFLLSPSTPTQPTVLPPPPPMVTGEYNPGVSVGDYVTYGNFVCNEVHQGEGWVCVNDLDFKKIEVIAVSGKEVTFLHTQQFKNGSATPISGCTETWDVEQAMWSDETDDWIDYCLIIAANLTEGDQIHSHACNFTEHVITITEVRTYLGVSRNVNLVITNHMGDWPVYSDDEYCNVTDIVVYDLASGFKLESERSTSDGNVISAMSIVETNIFSAQTPSPTSSSSLEATAQSIPMEVSFVISGLVVVVIVAAIAVILRKRKLHGGENDKE
jgi:hypothetical protein